MKVMKNYNSLFWIQNILLSASISIAAVFCIPNIMNWSIGKENANAFAGIGFLIACIAGFGILVWMGYERSKITPIKVAGRILLTIVVGLICIVLISCLCGIAASILYFLLKNMLLLDQIKGVLDFVITAVSILSIPMLCSSFWKGIFGKEGFLKGVKDGIAIKGKQYISLVGLLLIAFGLGVIITTIFHFVPSNILTDTVKIVLFTGVGTVALSGSEQILR